MGYDKQILASNLQRFMKLQNKTRKDICNDLGLKYTTFSDWMNGTSFPRIDKLQLLANYFNVSKSALIESEVGPSSCNQHIEQLHHYAERLNVQGMERLSSYAEELTHIPKYQKKKPLVEG